MTLDEAVATSSFVVLCGQHPVLRERLPTSGLAVHSYPFTVGRPPDEDEQSPASLCDLAFEDKRPYWIARVQFTLTRGSEGIWLIDSSSVYGTIVNGQPIGPGTDADRMLLTQGRNEVRLGGFDSPYDLTINVESYGEVGIAA